MLVLHRMYQPLPSMSMDGEDVGVHSDFVKNILIKLKSAHID